MLGFLIPSYYIPVQPLAAAMVDAALNGNSEQILECAEMREKGMALLGQ